MKELATLLLVTLLLSGCGGSESTPETSTTSVDRNLEDFYSSDEIEAIDSSESLDRSLSLLATQTTLPQFRSIGLLNFRT